MLGLKLVKDWWQAHRERHLQRLVSTDPRVHVASAQARAAAQQHQAARQSQEDAAERLREVERIRLRLLERGNGGSHR